METKGTSTLFSGGRELENLTREDQVVYLAAQGMTDKQAAQRLGISIGTINTYWQRVRVKFGATSRAQVIARSLIESQGRYVAVLSAFPEPIVIYENDMITFVNDKMLEVLGAKEPSEVIGKNAAQIVHPAELEDSRKRIKEITSGDSSITYLRRIVRADGKDVTLEVNATPLDKENRSFFAVVKVVKPPVG